MKIQFSSKAGWKTLVVALALALAVGMAGSVQAAAPQAQIMVKDQDISSGVVTFDSVTAPQDGWIVVYKDPNFYNGDIVGYAPVHQGVNTDVKVTLDARRIDANNTGRTGTLPTLWVRLHVDNGVMGLFEWGLRGLPYNDSPATVNGQPVIAEFGTTTSQMAPSAAPVTSMTTPAPSAPVATPAPVNTKSTGNTGPIMIKNQDISSGVVTFDSVTAPQDGWIVVYKDPAFNEGDVVGYAPVHQGVNTDVKVTLDARRIDANNTGRTGTLPTLWARLHVDNDVKGLFEWGLRGLPFNDTPVVENGHAVIAEFGTTTSQ